MIDFKTSLIWRAACSMVLCGLASCLSYNYSGVAPAEKQPDEGIVGMTKQQLIDTYGIPDRMLGVKSQTDQNDASDGRERMRPPSLQDDNAIYLYRGKSEHRVLLYERTRGQAYAVYLMDGKVSQVKTTVTEKGDGLSFGGLTPIPGGGGPSRGN